MGVFSRLSDIVNSNITTLLDQAENTVEAEFAGIKARLAKDRKDQ